jgi:L-2-hydroxyglutarate oxidase LhgO
VTDFDTIVVGGGIVGLATAARLARRGSLLLIERHDGICRETSSRNSEVVHAGIYYPTGSLKARACVRGKALLYERCEARGVAAPKVGKLIVAADHSELERMESLAKQATDNGVPLETLDRATLRARWPDVPGVSALWSPTTGVVDSHAYAASFEAEAEAFGADVLLHSEVVDAAFDDHHRLTVRHAGEDTEVTARVVVNAAGLGQDTLSVRAGLDVDGLGYRQHPCKGDWFAISDRHRGRIGTLLYPVGSAAGGGLGVHLCLDVGGGMRLGPDWEWIEGPPFDMRVDPSKRDAFWEAGRRLLPWLEPEDLRPDMAGVRAKLVPGPGMFRDFVVAEEGERGLPGWVTVAGIESPGLTAGAALAEEVESALVGAGAFSA